MKKIRLTKEEKAIENAILRGEYKPVPKAEFEQIAEAIARRKKDAVISIRVNSRDLESIKKKAKRLGVPYQTVVSELIHHYAA
jgi:predicted DNA binding CopG/RHH family protein